VRKSGLEIYECNFLMRLAYSRDESVTLLP
jgi:hypothetical protein